VGVLPAEKSDVRRFGYGEGVVDLDAEIA